VGDFAWQRAIISPEPKVIASAQMVEAINITSPFKFGNCSSDNGELFCEAVCAEVKVEQLKDGSLKMRCILPK
jgi:hypothetical protein